MSVSRRSNPFAEAVSAKTASEQNKPKAVSSGAGVSVPVGAPATRHPRGISLLTRTDRLEAIPLGRATLLSAALHLVSPILLFILTMIVLLLVSWLWHINPWDWFKPRETKPDLVFAIVQERHDPPPKAAEFRGNFNQLAGGVNDPKKPLAPVEDQVAPTPKPQSAKPQAAAAPTKTPEPPQPRPENTPEKTRNQPRPVSNKPPTVTAVSPSAVAQPSQSAASTGGDQSGATQVASASAVGASPANAQGGKSRLPGVNVRQDVDMGPYMAELKKRLDRNWKAQGIRSTRDHRVELMFYINRDGSLATVEGPGRRAGEPRIEIKRSSGNAQYDQWAVNAVEVSAPFKPLPAELEYDIVPILFTFDYNVVNP